MLTRSQAHDIASRHGFRLDKDFHALPSDDVAAIIAAADEYRYRKPHNANGSRARYFHALLVRASQRKES